MIPWSLHNSAGSDQSYQYEPIVRYCLLSRRNSWTRNQYCTYDMKSLCESFTSSPPQDQWGSKKSMWLIDILSMLLIISNQELVALQSKHPIQ